MSEQDVELEICGNCKKEIPHYNYVMHTAHCARNITLCKTCKEPVPKSQYEQHSKSCTVKKSPPKVKPEVPKTAIESSSYFQSRKDVEDRKQAERKERYLERHEKFLDRGHSMLQNGTTSVTKSSNTAVSDYSRNMTQTSDNGLSTSVTKNDSCNKGAIRKTNVTETVSKPKKEPGLLACRYCDLELPKMELEEHENYCGTRTDKCLECGELVMYKNKQVHLDSNHGFVKLKDEPGPRPSWDSSTQRSTQDIQTRRRFEPTVYTDLSQFDATDYLPSNYRIPKPKIEKGESYKEISRRLDCKTEYIRNLLHDSASITVPLRHNGTVPRNHFNHDKGPAPQPPARRRRNPPTELCIPCEFCETPIPHEELIQHETGCRPDLARFNPSRRSRRRSLDEEDDQPYRESVPVTPEVELPCEFCSDMIPASQLLRHQAACAQ